MRLRISVYIWQPDCADISLKTSYPYTYGRVVIGIIDMRINWASEEEELVKKKKKETRITSTGRLILISSDTRT